MIEQLGKYQIVGVIGRGGMGTVYRALDPTLDREVAIKVVSAEGELSVEQKARFIREGKACARLTHPNIVSIFELGEDAGRLFIVMELLHGQDLKQVIATHTALSVSGKLDLLIQMCDGLHHAHEKGIVHRDVKPRNLFVGQTGMLKILDFGLAHLAASTETSLTRTGEVVGTFAYMAPERFRGVTDHRADVFAVGAVSYELLSGRRAFVGETVLQLLEMIRTAHPPPLSSLDSSLPPELDAVIESTLHKDPAARLGDLHQLRAILDGVRQRLAAVVEVRADQLKTIQPGADERTPQSALDEAHVSRHDPGARRRTTRVARFGAHFRRFRVAISISFTVMAVTVIYVVNSPRYVALTEPRPSAAPAPSEMPVGEHASGPRVAQEQERQRAVEMSRRQREASRRQDEESRRQGEASRSQPEESLTRLKAARRQAEESAALSREQREAAMNAESERRLAAEKAAGDQENARRLVRALEEVRRAKAEAARAGAAERTPELLAAAAAKEAEGQNAMAKQDLEVALQLLREAEFGYQKATEESVRLSRETDAPGNQPIAR